MSGNWADNVQQYLGQAMNRDKFRTHIDEENSEYGGCEGPDAMYVKLISKDGHKFIIKRELAMMSPTIYAILNGPVQISEDTTNQIRFREVSSRILQKMCMHFIQKEFNPDIPFQIPEFRFLPEVCVELLLAANFLSTEIEY